MNLIDRFHALLHPDRLTRAQQLTLVKLVAVVAWADGKCVQSERDEITRLLKELARVNLAESDVILDATRTLTPELAAELAGLPEHLRHDVLKLVFRIANADDIIRDSEMDVIREVGKLVMPNKPWPLVEDWIRAQDALVKATRRLFT